MVDELQERRLGPVQIVEDGDDRLLPREALEELASGPEDLLDRELLKRVPHRRRDAVTHLDIVDECRQPGPGDIGGIPLLDRGRLADGLGQRPERDSLSVRETAPADDRRPPFEASDELAGEAGFPDARLAENRDEPARLGSRARVECFRQQAQLLLTADDRRIEPASERIPVAHGQQAERGDGLRLALQLERLDRLRVDRASDEPERLVADQHFPHRRVLLEARRDVDGVAEDERVRRLFAGDDLTGVDAGAYLEAEPPLLLVAVVQVVQAVAHLSRRPNGTESVVLAGERDAEDRHDGVADELSDDAAVLLEDRLHLLEVAGEQTPKRLRVESLAERRRAHDVREDHGDVLAHLPLLGRSLERRAAKSAQAELFGVFLPAAGADFHVLSLGSGAGTAQRATRTEATGASLVAAGNQVSPASAEPKTSPDVAPK